MTVGFPAVVTRDDSGIEKSKGLVMMFATALDSAPSYLDSVKAAGFGDEAEAIGERVRAGDLRGAVARARRDGGGDGDGGKRRAGAREIDAYREAGLTGIHLLPSPPGGYYPLYEGHFPVESLSQLPEFDFPGLIRSFSDGEELLT